MKIGGGFIIKPQPIILSIEQLKEYFEKHKNEYYIEIEHIDTTKPYGKIISIDLFKKVNSNSNSNGKYSRIHVKYLSYSISSLYGFLSDEKTYIISNDDFINVKYEPEHDVFSNFKFIVRLK